MWPSSEWLGMEVPPRSGTLGSTVMNSRTRAPALRPRTTWGGQHGHSRSAPVPLCPPQLGDSAGTLWDPPTCPKRMEMFAMDLRERG